MKKYILILLIALLSTAPLLAQYSPCYEAAFAEGKRLFNEKNYVQANVYFNEAMNCPDPDTLAVHEMLDECKNAIEAENAKWTTGSANDHEYVDLGLPSGTLWATCNIGASKPEDYGEYYAWGETQTKSIYNFATYKYAKGAYNKLTKYCSKSKLGNNGFTDNLTTLQASDDPATANWGSGWRTPTKAQWDELLNNTTNQWTSREGVNGCLFTAENGQRLFLPAAGIRGVDELNGTGTGGFYWTRSLHTGYPSLAWYLLFGSDGCHIYDSRRNSGHSVRPVLEK